jgi:hypothetical protein
VPSYDFAEQSANVFHGDTCEHVVIVDLHRHKGIIFGGCNRRQVTVDLPQPAMTRNVESEER